MKFGLTIEGKNYYQWREFSGIEREGHRGGLVTEGTRKLDLPDYSKINRTLSQYGCSLDLQPGARGDIDPRSKLADLPKKVLDDLNKVQGAVPTHRRAFTRIRRQKLSG